MVRCPDTSCKNTLNPDELGALVTKEEMKRWERLTLQKTLDGMADLVCVPVCAYFCIPNCANNRYCPKCETPTIEEATDHFAQCPSCSYCFCAICQGDFHPAVACMSAEDKLRVIQSRAAGNRNLGKEEREKHERMVKEAMNLVTVKRNSKPCPSCKMAIEKNGGCNKMTCGNCGTYFCWKCGRKVCM